jgi:hypothetical protein
MYRPSGGKVKRTPLHKNNPKKYIPGNGDLHQGNGGKLSPNRGKIDSIQASETNFVNADNEED